MKVRPVTPQPHEAAPGNTPMDSRFETLPAGPGRLSGALSLGCLGVTLVIAAAAALTAADIKVRAPAPGGDLQAMLSIGLVGLLAAGAAALICLVGAAFGLAGFLLAMNHPRGKPVLPAVGLVLNVLPIQAMVILFWVYDKSPGQRRTRRLIDGAVPLIDRLVSLSRLRVLRPALRQVLALIESVRRED